MGALFYRIHSFTVYSDALAALTRGLPNPCLSRSVPCRHICIATSNVDTVCTCKDGWQLLDGSDCQKVDETPDKTPPQPKNCPGDSELRIGACDTTTNFAWDNDKSLYTSLLIDEPAARSMELPLGDTVISSTARDEAGNLGECVFTVTVTQLQCPPRPPTLTDYKHTPVICQGGDKKFNVSCLKADHMVSTAAMNTSEASFEVTCLDTGIWFPSTTSFICVPPLPPATVATTTTVATPAATAKKTTTTTTTTTVTVTTTTTTTTAATTPTTPVTHSTTTTVATPVATPGSTETEIKEATDDDEAGAVPGAIASDPRPSKQPQVGLTGGDQAAIAIVVLVVLAIILAVGVFYWRRSGTGTFAFPVFWKTTTDDQSTLETNEVEGSHSYSVFN